MNGNILEGRRGVSMLLLSAVFMLLTVISVQPAAADSSGQCVTARINAPFRLPDGHVYPASVLTLCDGGTLSPVFGMHKILVGGSTIGLFVSRARTAENRKLEAPEILFTRDADGNLELVGYTIPMSGRSIAYRLKSRGDLWQASARHSTGGTSTASADAIIAASGAR